MGQGYYIVEISSNNTHLFIAAYDVESPESLLIELPEKRATDILKEFENDYESMASSLQVMNKRLVLLNPVSIHHARRFISNSMFFARRNLFKREEARHQRVQVDRPVTTCRARKVNRWHKQRCKCNKRECQSMLRLFRRDRRVPPSCRAKSK